MNHRLGKHMNGTAAIQPRPDFRQRSTANRIGAWTVLIAATLFAPWAQADNTLQDVSYTPMTGGKVQVTLKFAAPVVDPRVFTTESPPRIAVDIADTHSAVSQRHLDVQSGATAGINTAEAGGRTRVVVDLYRPSTYETHIEGNNLVLVVGGGVTATAAAAATVGQRSNEDWSARRRSRFRISTSVAEKTVKAALS